VTLRLPAAPVVLAIAFAFACGSSRAGSGSVGQADGSTIPDGGQFPGGDGGVTILDAGSAGDGRGGPVPAPDAGSQSDAGAPAADGGPIGADGGTAASDCPRSFDLIPAGPPPLQAAGDAHAGALMTPLWEIRAPANFRLEFEGLMDSRGNLFWAEENGQLVVVASAGKDGTLRFRTPTALSDFARLRLAGYTMVGIDNPQSLPPAPPPQPQASMTGFSTETGQPLWTTHLDPIIQSWAASPGVLRIVIDSIAVTGNTVVVAAGGGLIAVDAATGNVRWSERPSTDPVFSAQSAIASSGGVLFASITTGGSHPALAKSPVQNPPSIFFSGVLPELFAAPGPMLLGAITPPFAPASPAFFCQSDAHLIAQFDSSVSVVSTLPFVATTTANSVWLRQGTTLLLYDLATGKLKIRADAKLPPGDGPFDEFHPMVESDNGLLWIDQTITFPRNGSSANRQQGPPTLHVFQADAREVRKRALPMEAEAYTGTGASFGDRVFLGGEVLPSAGAFGVIRAFDLPGWAAGNVMP
jgi:hypothetical protein